MADDRAPRAGSRDPDDPNASRHKRAPRICLLSHNYYFRDTRVRRYARTLLDAGARVHVLCLPSPTPFAGADARAKLVTIPIGRSYGGRLAYLLEYALSFCLYALYLTALQIRYGYQIIQVHNGPDILIWAAWLPRLLGARLVLDLRDPMPELYRAKFGGESMGWVQRLLRWQEKLSCWIAHAVITANSNFEVNLIQRGLAPDKLTVLTNAPDLEIFQRQRHPPAPPPEAERFVLIYAGTIAPRYGLDVAIRALLHLIAEIPQIRLRLIGPQTHYTTELVALAHQLGVSEYVEFVPAIPIERVPEEMSRAHVGLYPAIKTPHTDIATPCKVLEYAVMGLPVVAARLEILRQIFGDGALAFFEPGDPEDLARCVRALYADPERRAALVRAADEVYVMRSGWEQEQQTYFALLNRLLPPDRKFGNMTEPREILA
ncbi:MAG: glycosyltransferase family 4 protein [Anaerolineae bacterium]|nr:glycosyltransferase family 4 protein [Anaerolineae bacterium]